MQNNKKALRKPFFFVPEISFHALYHLIQSHVCASHARLSCLLQFD